MLVQQLRSRWWASVLLVSDCHDRRQTRWRRQSSGLGREAEQDPVQYTLVGSRPSFSLSPRRTRDARSRPDARGYRPLAAEDTRRAETRSRPDARGYRPLAAEDARRAEARTRPDARGDRPLAADARGHRPGPTLGGTAPPRTREEDAPDRDDLRPTDDRTTQRRSEDAPDSRRSKAPSADGLARVDDGRGEDGGDVGKPQNRLE